MSDKTEAKKINCKDMGPANNKSWEHLDKKGQKQLKSVEDKLKITLIFKKEQLISK